MGTEDQWVQRNIWGQGNSGHRETMKTEEQLETEEQWEQRNSGHKGTVGTEEQWGQMVPSPEWGSKMGKKHVSTSNIISIS